MVSSPTRKHFDDQCTSKFIYFLDYFSDAFDLLFDLLASFLSKFHGVGEGGGDEYFPLNSAELHINREKNKNKEKIMQTLPLKFFTNSGPHRRWAKYFFQNKEISRVLNR